MTYLNSKIGLDNPRLPAFCHSCESRNLKRDSGYSAKAEFRNDKSGDTWLFTARLFIAIIVILFFTSVSFTQSVNDFEVKSLNVYTTASKTSLAVVTAGSRLVIEFDVQADFIPNMNIVFRFCDKGWTPAKNVFLLNNLNSTAYFLDFEQLPSTVADAQYHFKGEYPNNKDDVRFPFSGKWKFYLTDTQDTSIVYATGKFLYVKQEVPLSVRVKQDELEDKNYWPIELAKAFNVTTNFNLPAQFHPSFVSKIEIIENHLIYNPIIVDRLSNTLFRKFEWDANRKFTFIARDIQAGNEFRQVDIRNNNIFSSKDVKAQLDGLEFSRFLIPTRHKDMNGGMLFADFKDTYSTYLNVIFSIRPPDDVYGEIFLIGAFNNWKLSLDYEMKKEAGISSITIPLKRGIYDYQYVAADVINGEIINDDWLVLEGNTWVNNKEYDVFLYYNEPNLGGYERIIGYSRIRNKR